MEISHVLMQPISSFLDPGERVYWVYITTALVISMLLFMTTKSQDQRLSHFLGYCFPASIWRHRSTRTDVIYFIINRVLFALLLAPFAVLAYPVLNSFFLDVLVQFGAPGIADAPTWVLIAFAVVAVAAFDLSVYLAHLAQHKIPLLWQFHKVHHSAEVLNPLTVYRMHPVDDLLTLSFGVILGSAVHAVFSFLWADSFSSLQLTVTGLAVMFFYVFGYHLRHSHIWLSYGPVLSRLLISPAQHQIHHSREMRHRDKNLGFMFSIGDGLFGTLYVPKSRETFAIGLSGDQSLAYRSAISCYLKPFRDSFAQQKLAAVALATVFVGASTVSISGEFSERTKTSVFLEALTTTEVRSLVASGYRSVIIPTGGVEQNGEHVVLGKHNYVVAHAAERIALELGTTLIAPVITYVPEGSITPPEAHMRFAGTISVRESTFKAILEDAARSLIQHGFTRVYFIGDSLGNQAAQAAVATQLQNEFAGRDITVMHVGNYYDSNGQFEWLQAKGFADEQIGWHAGLRDSSEVLYVAPEMIRSQAIRLSAQTEGVSGAYWRASPEIGKNMIELKARAAVSQIRGNVSVVSSVADDLDNAEHVADLN